MIPTSIDGTDITGATIDGTDVQEITVDGQTVFTSAPQINNFPVAYSNLIAWYPFDSATYGGSNADDVTAILGGSGDDTAFDGTVNGATYQSSGGNKDINAGDGSGYYDFNNPDYIETSTTSLTDFAVNDQPFSYSVWVQFTNLFDNDYKVIMGDDNLNTILWHRRSGLNEGLGLNININGTLEGYGGSSNLIENEWLHCVATYDGNGDVNLYVDSVNDTSFKFSTSPVSVGNFYIGNYDGSPWDVASNIDDVRVYDKELTSSEVNQIFTNTKPSSKP